MEKENQTNKPTYVLGYEIKKNIKRGTRERIKR
jgi:hypothetical protein